MPNLNLDHLAFMRPCERISPLEEKTCNIESQVGYFFSLQPARSWFQKTVDL